MICCYLLLAGEVSGFTPVIYNAQVTSECGQSDPLQDEQLMEALSKIVQELGPPGCNPPRNRSCQEILSPFYTSFTHSTTISSVVCQSEDSAMIDSMIHETVPE